MNPDPGNPDASPDAADLAIVGNGAVAMSIAIEHRRRAPDARVVLIGPGRRPGSASLAAGIMLASHSEVEANTFRHAAGRAKFELVKAAVERWPGWMSELAVIARGESPRIHHGTVVLDNPNVSGFDPPNFDAILEALRRDDAEHESVDPSDLRGYRSAAHLRASRGVRIPGDGAVDAVAVIALLDGAAGALGIERLDGRAESVRDGIVRCDLGREVRAKRIVVAAGAASDGLLRRIPELVGRVPRILHGTGVGLRCRATPDLAMPAEVLRTPNRGAGLGVYHVPSGSDRFYLGATNVVSAEPRAHARLGSLHLVLQSAMDEISADLRHAECRMVTGHRPIAEDGLPLLGATSLPGLWIATGTRRDGVTAAPEIARRLVNEMLGEGDPLPAAFSPERAPISMFDREQGVEVAVRSRLVGPGSNAEPRAGRLDDEVRRQVERLYDRAGLVVGVPAELLDLYADGRLDASRLHTHAKAD